MLSLFSINSTIYLYAPIICLLSFLMYTILSNQNSKIKKIEFLELH